MALGLAFIAFGVGVGLGLRWGGEPGQILLWRPVLWEALASGLVLIGLLELTNISGGFAAFLRIAATLGVLAFAVVNVRIGGMILVASGTGLNFLASLVNWGRPVNGSALVHAGIIPESMLDRITLTGGRKLVDPGVLGFLGDVIPLPWHQVISIGDVSILVGITLVTASLMRDAHVPHHSSLRGSHSRSGHGGTLTALGRGPAPRRGPGLHPSRLGGSRRTQRPSPGRPSTGRRPR